MNEILRQTYALGQSIWYDSISRAAIRNGELAALRDEGVRGVTTNPSIFRKALAADDYDGDIRDLIARGRSDIEIYDALTIAEVRDACAVFRTLWDAGNGGDGFVSLEVNPLIADDKDTTVMEALRLWRELDCPNAMIKIPATEAGIGAIEEATAAGINVNATLIFSVAQYEAVARAYIRGLEHRRSLRLPLAPASVASVFVSRIDTALDPVLAEKAPALAGKIALANAHAVYAKFREIFTSPRWAELAACGARVQRPLWASTGVKNPAYPPTLYTDNLIGPDTVNTLPPAALDAFMRQGTPAATATAEYTPQLEALAACGISLDAVTGKLMTDGIASFAQSFGDIMDGIAAKRARL